MPVSNGRALPSRRYRSSVHLLRCYFHCRSKS
jgi:hypothetical protein